MRSQRVAVVAIALIALTSLAGPSLGHAAGRHQMAVRSAQGASRTARTAPAAVGHRGRWLTDRAGRVLEVHGLNLVIKKPPYRPAKEGISADDARFLHRHGFNAVRLGVLMEALEPSPGHFDNHYLHSVIRTAHLLARHGIRSLIDFHQDLFATTFQGEGLPTWMVQTDGVPNLPALGFPGNYFANEALARAFDNFWADAAGPNGRSLQSWYAGAWRHVARKLRGDDAVLGYDIFNEPWPGTGWQTCFPPLGCQAMDTNLLAPFSHRVIHAIHAVDPSHLAFYEPWQPFSEGAPTHVGDPGDRSSGFSFHTYCAAALGLPETQPTRAACDLVEHDAVTAAVKHGNAARDAILLTEFGATSDTAELDSVESFADRQSVPWLEWAYCACGDPTGSGRVEALVYDPRQPPHGANVNHTTLPVLDEPYPQHIAGTPQGYSFDQATGRFQFQYSTRRPSSGGRAHGTTVIYASPMHYPHGYRVRVRGGRVVARHARQLTVRASAHAKTVRVVLRPR